jgi:hypothetical protein
LESIYRPLLLFFFGKLIDDETNKVSEQPYVAVTHCQGFCADLGNLIIPLAQLLLKYDTKISQNSTIANMEVWQQTHSICISKQECALQ